jgi:hypothetical protein
VGLELKACQQFSEVTRTYLAGSTRAVDGLGETEFLFFRHNNLLAIFYYEGVSR